MLGHKRSHIKAYLENPWEGGGGTLILHTDIKGADMSFVVMTFEILFDLYLSAKMA